MANPKIGCLAAVNDVLMGYEGLKSISDFRKKIGEPLFAQAVTVSSLFYKNKKLSFPASVNFPFLFANTKVTLTVEAKTKI